ncbi:MAG: hypothetical protein P8M20_00480 [Planctomycetaceae bacterium]|nr:hypothetical protein [Planctomycetaceae bacterium]
MVNIPEGPLGFHSGHGLYGRRGLDTERAGHALRTRHDAPEDTPCIQIAGIAPSPNATWMKQVCRNLTDSEAGFLGNASHLIVDRSTSFIATRKFIDKHTDTEVVLLPLMSPNLNALMERWFLSLKSTCIKRMLFFGRRSLENAVHVYL